MEFVVSLRRFVHHKFYVTLWIEVEEARSIRISRYHRSVRSNLCGRVNASEADTSKAVMRKAKATL